jgi:hypothetical protein
MQLGDAQGLAFSVAAAEKWVSLRSEDGVWQGAISLPGVPRDGAQPGKAGCYYIARLGGYTETYPYSLETDSAQLSARDEHPVFAWLLACDLAGQACRVRTSAVHARSRTFTRKTGAG